MSGRIRSRLAVAAALVLAGACSAPLDSGPRTIRAASLPEELRAGPSSTTTTTAPTGDSEEVTIYFIGKDDRLFPVKRRVSRPVTVEKVLENLFAGPITAERVLGLHTAISAQTTVLSAQVERAIVTVDVSEDFALGRSDDQISAYAQVVFTASDIPGVTGVRFTLNGRRQEVPEGDGSLNSAPLGRAAYPQLTPR